MSSFHHDLKAPHADGDGPALRRYGYRSDGKWRAACRRRPRKTDADNGSGGDLPDSRPARSGVGARVRCGRHGGGFDEMTGRAVAALSGVLPLFAKAQIGRTEAECDQRLLEGNLLGRGRAMRKGNEDQRDDEGRYRQPPARPPPPARHRMSLRQAGSCTHIRHGVFVLSGSLCSGCGTGYDKGRRGWRGGGRSGCSHPSAPFAKEAITIMLRFCRVAKVPGEEI